MTCLVDSHPSSPGAMLMRGYFPSAALIKCRLETWTIVEVVEARRGPKDRKTDLNFLSFVCDDVMTAEKKSVHRDDIPIPHY